MNSQRDLPLTNFKPHTQIYAIVQTGSGDYALIGHGFLSVLTDEIENETVHYLEVQSVKDGEVMLRSRLRLSNNYEKQRGSVIVWNDSEQKLYFDLALSFEGDKQCDVFWRLICEKVGKNYLDINGRDTLEIPNETNLLYVLDKTKTAKDMVQYYLLNQPAFAAALATLFKKFQEKGDKMGMGMVGRIVKSIFSNLDYKMVQILFEDPIFELILEVQKFLHEIDFPQWWNEWFKMRSIVPLGDDLKQKIHIIHRLSFYRENILDLLKESYLEHMLVMTQIEFCKEIILHLTKENTLEDLIKLTYQPTQETLVLQQKDNCEDDTFLAENQEIRRLQFAERKLEFLMEALIISKQIQSENIRLKFYDSIFKSGVIEMATEFLDRGILKALDFFNCLAQSTPLKFLDYLKLKYREKPSDNLHIKLSKKYCVGREEMQSSILEIIKNISECFKIKQNLDFFIGTFFASVFGCCKEMRAVLNVVNEVQNILESVESFFSQVMRSQVFHKLSTFLRSQKQDKSSELRAIKILKRSLLENADSSWSFKKGFLNKLNEEIIKSGFFDYCMIVLEKNLRFNNIISSSMLQNIRILRDMSRFTLFHKEIQKNYQQSETLGKYIKPILQMKEEKVDTDITPFGYERELEIEQEQQQAYLMSEMPQEINSTTLNAEAREQLQSLRRLRNEISLEEEDQQRYIYQSSLPSKKVKINEQVAICIDFELPFDQFEEGDK